MIILSTVDLIEPLKAYKTFLKDEVKKNAEKYFMELAKKSGVDEVANSDTVKKYRNLKSHISELNKKINKIRGMWTFFIVFSIVLLVIGLGFIGYGDLLQDGLMKTISIIITILLAIGLIVLIVIRLSVIRKQIKGLQAEIEKMKNASDKLLNEACVQMSELNSLYDWNIPSTIINMSQDLIHMDKFLDPEKFQYLYENYGLKENDEQNVSTVFVQSGEIYGNPFMLCKDCRQEWYQRDYTGSITIHWTTYIHTKDGTRAIHHTQTLVAHVYKPAPSYDYVTYLLYGNEAAPKLKFSRGPSGITNKTEKQIKKMIIKESKQLDKKAVKALMDDDPNTNYQRFGNDEFESLFDGTNRNNEVEFRLLFTPLAQKNLIELIREKEPYGDDWYFTKNKMLNYIQSYHSQRFNYVANPEIFIDYSFEDAKRKFINYISAYFESFYYDLLPLLSIPLYQMHKSKKYIYKDLYPHNVASYEQEVIANSFDKKVFAHPESDTKAILKVNTEAVNGKTDIVKVVAHSFKAIPQVEYVTKIGGDGHSHVIPVHYYIYEPLEQENYMAIGEKPSSRRNYLEALNGDSLRKALLSLGGKGDNVYQRGLFAYVLHDFTKNASVESVNKAFASNAVGNKKFSAKDLFLNELKDKYGDIDDAISRAKSMTQNSNIQEVEEKEIESEDIDVEGVDDDEFED